MKRAFAAAAALSLCLSTPAFAQDADILETTTPPAEPAAGYYDDGGNWIPPSRDRAPDTDHCPQATWPPEPVSTSERAAPGDTPAPLPQRYDGPCGVSTPVGYSVDPGVVASAWAVVDLDTGEVVAMKDPHGRYRPASLIKVLLAMVVIDELNMDAPVPVSAESAGQEGSAAGIGEGGVYTVRDLLHGLLLASGNDCAHALAQALGGDEIALLKVNQLAQRLGMQDTRVTTYSGLDSPGMTTSAWDMALAYRAAFQNPIFADTVDTEHYAFPGFDDLPGFELWNDNKLYLNDPEGIGGKTGYTDDANHTFAGAVSHDGRRLLAVVLDTTAWDLRPWEQAQKLLQAAYPIPPGSGVGNLGDVETGASTSEAPIPTPTAEPERDNAPAGGRARWVGIGAVAAVAVAAAAATAISLASPRKRSRRR